MPINKLTTLLDLSRQSKIISGETATFDGKILVGIPFSGYPSGVDISTSVSLGVVSSETAVFSSDTGTTVFDVSNPLSTNYDAIFSGLTGTTWSNPLFSAYTSGLTLPIIPLSAETQIVGPFWSLTQTGKTGDYIIGIQYTGFSITYSFNEVSLFGTGFTYSGLTTATQENFSAGTLDYKGPLDYISSVEDATINGRVTTDRITITDGASPSTIGYVLTQTGENGEGEWLPNSSADTNTFVTGGTYFNGVATFINNSGGTFNVSGFTQPFSGGSGNCISDLFVSNIHSCSPLNINPLDEGNVYFGSNSGVTIDIINNFIGVGTDAPTSNIDVFGGLGGRISVTTQGSGAVSNSNFFNLYNDSGLRGNNLYFSRYGGNTATPTDFVDGSSVLLMNLLGSVYKDNNLQESAAIQMWAKNISSSNYNGYIEFSTTSGVTLSTRMLIDPNGYVGINTLTPSELLDVSGKTKTINFQMTSGGTNGYVLTSDASGNASWQPSSGGVPSSTTANTTTINFTGQTIYYDASTSGSGNITEDLTDAKLGLIQKIYHNDVTEPTYPAGWVLMGDAIYFTSTLNIIYAEWAGGSRVEYWYVQEQ
jgi:hypothetical protein